MSPFLRGNTKHSNKEYKSVIANVLMPRAEPRLNKGVQMLKCTPIIWPSSLLRLVSLSLNLAQQGKFHRNFGLLASNSVNQLAPPMLIALAAMDGAACLALKSSYHMTFLIIRCFCTNHCSFVKMIPVALELLL
jgi:hypothetical protein